MSEADRGGGAAESAILAADEIAFVLCVEANALEAQARLLCESIRWFGGRYRDAEIVAVAPRRGLELAPRAAAELEALGVTYVAEPLNRTGSPYGSINRIVTGAWAEQTLTRPYLVVLDSDMVFVDEPTFLRADAGVRPVDGKGSTSTGPDDPMDAYWAAMCGLAGVDLSILPMLRPSLDTIMVRASYNGGFTVVRRELGVLTKARDLLLASMEADLRPYRGSGVNVFASTGPVGVASSEMWGSNQTALSISIWSSTRDVLVYGPAYNVPLHILADQPGRTWPDEGPPVLLHYHYLLDPARQAGFVDAARRIGCSPEALAWLEERMTDLNARETQGVGLCTLAIHAPYRRRARVLFGDMPNHPWVVLTDEPEDFADLPLRAVGHQPTGPMAVDYIERLAPVGNNRGAAAYHDKRFALMATLEKHRSAIFLDADSRISDPPAFPIFPPGISVLPFVDRTIAEHLEIAGSWRLPHFEALAEHLTGSTDILRTARWCQESCFAITKDGREDVFFETWGRAGDFVQARELFSGEGGVIGLAAAMAGWTVDYSAIVPFGASVVHEGGGPKQD